ncbi:MAG: hypothetical protein V2A72_08240 [Candidatus Omnitrophota bacterium]
MGGIGTILIGIYITLIGFKVISASKNKGEAYEKWHAKWGSKMKIAGPILIVLGIVMLFVK